MIQARDDFAAGIVRDETTYDEFVIVTGGYLNGISLDSTEILVDNQWHQGKISHDSSILSKSYGTFSNPAQCTCLHLKKKKIIFK